jgi:hypothetical protein
MLEDFFFIRMSLTLSKKTHPESSGQRRKQERKPLLARLCAFVPPLRDECFCFFCEGSTHGCVVSFKFGLPKHPAEFLLQCLLLAVFSAVPVAAQTGAADSLRIAGIDSVSGVPKPVNKKKNPTGAAFRSLAIPGWGQYYNGQKIKAALVMAAELGEIGTAIYWNMRAKETSDPEEQFIYKDYRNQAYWFLAGTILLAMLDAYVDAHLADFDEGPSLQENNAGAALPPDTRFAIRMQIRL